MKRFALVFLLSILLVSSATPLCARNIESVSTLYSFWGDLRGPVIHDEHAFIRTSKTGLQVIDLTPLDDPRHRDIYPERIMAGGQYWNDHLWSSTPVDISDPPHPVALPEIRGRYRDIQCFCVGSDFLSISSYNEEGGRGQYVYYSSLDIFDVSDPSQPRNVLALHEDYLDYWYEYMQTIDNMLFVKAHIRGSIEIFDLNTIPNLEQIGTFNPDYSISSTLVVDTLLLCGERDAGLHVYDISDLDRIEEISYVELDEDEWRYFSVNGNLLFRKYYNREDDNHLAYLRIYDMSDPSDINLLSQYEENIYECYFSTDGEVVVLTNRYQQTLKFLDVSNPEEPREVSSLDHSGNALDIDIVGDLAYLAAGSRGLRVIDVSDPYDPMEIGCTEEMDSVLKVSILNDRAYVKDGNKNMLILDTDNPESISEIARIDSLGYFIDYSVTDEVIAVYIGFNTIRLYDNSDADDPTLIDSISDERFEWPKSVLLHENYLLLGGQRCLSILDISDPEHYEYISGTPMRGTVADIEVSEGHVFVADNSSGAYDNGIWILDISNPSHPDYRSCFNLPDVKEIIDIDVVGDFLYAACGDSGIKVINISCKRDPFLTGDARTPNNARSLAVHDNHAVVANFWNMEIFDCSQALDVNERIETITPGSMMLVNYPNPFNNSTTISFDLPHSATGSLKLYDLSGQLVSELQSGQRFEAGCNRFVWSPEGLASGTYMLRLETENASAISKTVFLK